MTLHLDLETWFKTTADILPKGSLWLNYEQDWVKGGEDMFRTSNPGRTDSSLEGARSAGP